METTHMKSDQETRTTLELLNEEVRSEMESIGLKEPSLAGIRISVEVLDYFGIAAKPVPVRVAISNKVATKQAKLSRPIEGRGRVLFCAPYNDEPFGLGKNDYNGHLVIHAGKYVTDPLLYLYSRPNWQIPLIGTVYEAPPTIDSDGFTCGYVVGGGVQVIYLEENDKTYLSSFGWRDVEKMRPSIGRIIRRIRERMQNEGDQQ